MRMIDADAFKKHLATFVVGGAKAIEETTCGNEWIDGIHTAYREIGNMPTIDSFGSWIPVEERLPENINLVLVTWENTNPESYYKSIKGKKFCGAGHYCNGKWFWESKTCQDYLAEYGKCDWDEMDEAIKVIAWMPLPKPYEKEVNDNGRKSDS